MFLEPSRVSLFIDDTELVSFFFCLQSQSPEYLVLTLIRLVGGCTVVSSTVLFDGLEHSLVFQVVVLFPWTPTY